MPLLHWVLNVGEMKYETDKLSIDKTTHSGKKKVLLCMEAWVEFRTLLFLFS
jgi:hypothetical protein